MNKKTKKQKQYLIRFGYLLVTVGIVFVAAHMAKAASTDNTFSWLWGGSDDGAGNSDGIGWISLNDTNTAGAVPYGVNIPLTDGNLNGYAWSENYGWISFNAGDIAGCPTGAAAQRVGNNLQGWARSMSAPQAGANAGGASGCISLSSKNCDANGDGKSDGVAGCPAVGTLMATYGVTLTPATGKLSGSAYSEEGYIAFSGTNYQAMTTIVIPNYALSVDATMGIAVTSTAPDNSYSCSSSTCPPPVKTYPAGTTVTLKETPQANYTFTGWSGGTCSGTSTTCTFIMDSDKIVNTGATCATTDTCATTNCGDACIKANCSSSTGTKNCAAPGGAGSGTFKEVTP